MIAELVKSVADLLEIILPVLNIALVGGDLKTDLNKLEPQIRSELAWTGDRGSLIYVPVGQNPGTEQLFYQGLKPKGSGEAPDVVLASSIGKPQLEPRLDISDEHTFFIWYDSKVDGWGIIPPELVADLRLRAIALKNDAATLSAIQEKQRNDIFAHAVDVLRSRSTDDSIRKMLLESSQKISGYRQKVADIEAKLNEAIAKAQKAAEFQQRLQLMQNVISGAQLVAQAKDLIPGAGIKDDDNIVTVGTKVREYKKEQDGVIIRRREEEAVQIRLTNEEAAKLRPLFKQAGAPNEITDWELNPG